MAYQQTSTIKGCVLFDLDGTLLDSAPDFIAIINTLLSENHLPNVDPSTLREQVSEGARAMLSVGFGKRHPQLEALLSDMLERYHQAPCVYSQLFDGFYPLFNRIEENHLSWGVVTNKPRRFSEQILHTLELDQRCSILICPEDVKETKPSPEPLLLASKQLELSPRKIIYVGDHIRDIQSAKAAQMYSIAALYGYIKADEDTNSWQADQNADCVNALWPIIENYFTL
jgi:2-phosphoglycolate phosphatase